jgi:DNA uptake protein ComE-like DNA-binding protein
LPAGRKVLIVLDQFEQWLAGERRGRERELVAALRQCDGEHVHAMVAVRDDSWLATSRFLRDLEERIVEGVNAAAVDPFDLRHARRVLEAIGRAYGALPDAPIEPLSLQESFLVQAVSGLARADQVLPVRLAHFGLAVKNDPWVPATLKRFNLAEAGVPLRCAGIDLNSVDQKTLEALPGIGSEIAARIVASRPYRSVDDLRRVKGMGRKRVDEIRHLVIT